MKINLLIWFVAIEELYMKRYLYMTFAVLGFLGSTIPYAEAGNLTGVRVSNHEGTSRIVLDVSEMPVSWTKSYNESTHALTLNLGGTTNGLTGPIAQNNTKTGVLKGIGLQPVNGSLQVTLTANKDVQHHEFTLEKPSRIVVDLFSSYAQQTTKDVNKSVTYSKINNTVAEGKIQAFALSVDNDSPMVVAHVSEGKPLSSVVQSHTAIIGAKVKGGSFDRPYSVASDGTIDLERISNRGTLRYTPNRGYFIEEKRPLLQAKTQKDTFLITSVNTSRKENALTLYTSAYGESTKTNDFGYEVTVANGKVVSGQKGNSKIGENQYVLSGHGESRDALRKLKVGTPITIQNRPELAQVNTTGGAALQAGTMVLKNGNYVGADGTHNKARSFIGTTKDHNLVVLTVDKAGLQSVGVTQQEGAQLLSKLGVVDGAELSNQGSVDLVVNDTYVHKATSNPTTYEDIVIIK